MTFLIISGVGIAQRGENMIISKRSLVLLGLLSVVSVAGPAWASTKVYKVTIACPGQTRFFEQIETANEMQAIKIMKARYPGCNIPRAVEVK
jgi:hypothetical protein